MATDPNQFNRQQGAGDLLDRQRKYNSAAYQGKSDDEKARMYEEEAKGEKQKNLMTEILMGIAGAQANRGVPAYDKNMVNGREGLVDPRLTGQQTMVPLPWDERYASTANLLGIQNSTRLYAPSEQVVAQVNSLTPQMQRAVRPMHTIYQNTPDDWMTNRLNLALQRRRESSVYAIV